MTYYWVALAYAEKAHYEPDTKDESLKLVSEYARKSVALDPNNRVIGFNVAWVLEYAGDVDSSSRCKYYAGSQVLLNQMSIPVSGDAVLENKAAESTSRISQKVKASHCGCSTSTACLVHTPRQPWSKGRMDFDRTTAARTSLQCILGVLRALSGFSREVMESL